MKSRRRMSSGRSKRLFRNTARKTHIKNVPHKFMRGGIRL